MSVYFRVADVYRDHAIVVKSQDGVIWSRKKQKLAPGEMECVTLTAEQLAGVRELTFGLEAK